MGFFDAVAGAAKQAARPAPQSSGLGAVVQAVAQGSQRGAQQAASSNVGAAAAVGASQGFAQAKAKAEASRNALTVALRQWELAGSPTPGGSPGPFGKMLNSYGGPVQRIQALRNFMVKTGLVASSKALGVEPLDLLYGSVAKADKTYLLNLVSPPDKTPKPDSTPVYGTGRVFGPAPSPKGWSPKGELSPKYPVPFNNLPGAQA